MWQAIKLHILELITDDSKRISLSKTILLFGFIFLNLFTWKLIITSEFNEYYFAMYITFIGGNSNLSKYLDNKKTGVSDGK